MSSRIDSSRLENLKSKKGVCMLIEEFKEQYVSCSKSVADICYAIIKTESVIDKDKEHFWSIGLDTSNKIKYVDLVSLGILNQAISAPREVYRQAIMQGINSLIICHNHPSGSLEPSPEDRKFTGQLYRAGEIIGIKLLDHVIIGTSGHYSFSDSGGLT